MSYSDGVNLDKGWKRVVDGGWVPHWSYPEVSMPHHIYQACLRNPNSISVRAWRVEREKRAKHLREFEELQERERRAREELQARRQELIDKFQEVYRYLK